MKKVKINILVNTSGVILNLILNFVFINKFGFYGAAMTTAAINILTTLFYVLFLKKILKGGEKINDSK